MSHCYFIGGPLDLTKSVHRRPEPRLFALAASAFTLNDIHTAQDAENARKLVRSRHVYQRLPGFTPPVHGVPEQPCIYAYVGLEHDTP